MLTGVLCLGLVRRVLKVLVPMLVALALVPLSGLNP